MFDDSADSWNVLLDELNVVRNNHNPGPVKDHYCWAIRVTVLIPRALQLISLNGPVMLDLNEEGLTRA